MKRPRDRARQNAAQNRCLSPSSGVQVTEGGKGGGDMHMNASESPCMYAYTCLYGCACMHAFICVYMLVLRANTPKVYGASYCAEQPFMLQIPPAPEGGTAPCFQKPAEISLRNSIDADK